MKARLICAAIACALVVGFSVSAGHSEGTPEAWGPFPWYDDFFWWLR